MAATEGKLGGEQIVGAEGSKFNLGLKTETVTHVTCTIGPVRILCAGDAHLGLVSHF